MSDAHPGFQIANNRLPHSSDAQIIDRISALTLITAIPYRAQTGHAEQGAPLPLIVEQHLGSANIDDPQVGSAKYRCVMILLHRSVQQTS